MPVVVSGPELLHCVPSLRLTSASPQQTGRGDCYQTLQLLQRQMLLAWQERVSLQQAVQGQPLPQEQVAPVSQGQAVALPQELVVLHDQALWPARIIAKVVSDSNKPAVISKKQPAR